MWSTGNPRLTWEDLRKSSHCCYSVDAMNWFDYHEEGNAECDACVVPPVSCETCQTGLVHTQLDEELEAVEARCDQCSAVDVPEPVAVE